MNRLEKTIKTTLASNWLPVVLLYFAGLALNSVTLFPTYNEINYWDTLVYAGTGKDLVENASLWPYPRGPMISFVYAAIYMLLDNFDIDNWVLASIVLELLASYTLLFLSCWCLGRELWRRGLSHPLALLGLITALPVFRIFIINPSYALFVPFACFSFWRLTVYFRTRKLSTLLSAGFFLAFACLVRPDLILAIIFLLLAVSSCRSPKSFLPILASAIAPLIVLVGGYILAFGLHTGIYQFGGGDKMYATFEAAQQVLMALNTNGLHDFELAEIAKKDSQREFGTAEENHHSVLRAIARNPKRFIQMVWANNSQRTIPMLFEAYGARSDSRIPLQAITLVVGFLAIRGAIELIKRKEWRLLTMSVFWLGQLGVYLITISFSCYLAFPFYVIFMLAAIGISASIGRMGIRSERVQWYLLLAAIIYWTSVHSDVSMRSAALLMGILIMVTAVRAQSTLRNRWRGCMIGAAMGGLLALNWPTDFRFAWPGPPNEYEKQAAFLKRHFLENTITMAYPGAAVVLAKMKWVSAIVEYKDIHTPGEFKKFIQQNGIRVIVVDPWLVKHNVFGMWSVIQMGKDFLKPVYQSNDGKFAVLVPNFL